jgi:AcrR family transcriptional regulator
MPGASRGRRPGTSRTREAILAAARKQFADRGYERASLRAIAAQAGVDAALISHFFGSKQRLLVAAVELPFDPRRLVPEVLAGPRRSIGERLARAVVSLLEDPEARSRVTSLVRAAATEPAAARMVRDLLTRRVFGPVARQLGADNALLRANLAGSQVVGLVMARYVVGVEPLASLPAADLVTAIGPTFQRYLTGPLPAG